jgi:hypothetical protein
MGEGIADNRAPLIAQHGCKCRQDVLLVFEQIAHRSGNGSFCGFG